MRTPPGEDAAAGWIASCITLFVLETWSGATTGLFVIGRHARENRRKRSVTVVKRFIAATSWTFPRVSGVAAELPAATPSTARVVPCRFAHPDQTDAFLAQELSVKRVWKAWAVLARAAGSPLALYFETPAQYSASAAASATEGSFATSRYRRSASAQSPRTFAAWARPSFSCARKSGAGR